MSHLNFSVFVPVWYHCLTANYIFSKIRQIEHFWRFKELMFTQDVNLARFTRNYE